MYWREYFPNQQAMIATARRFRAGIPITRAQHVAIQHGLGELTETPELGSLKSFFKKAVKVANKLDPLYSVRKKIDPVTKAVDRAAGIKVTSSPKMAPSQELVVPLTPTVPMDTSPVALPFNMQAGQSGGGGGGFAPMPADASANPAAAADAGPNWLLIGGASAAGLLILYLLLKKRH